MVQLVIMRGPPASGKSTVVRQGYAGTHVVVNRDDIRFTMFGAYYGSTVNESVVTDVENSMIESALRSGRHTVVDATNLNHRALKTKLSLASRYDAEVVWHDLEVPLEEAIRRDASRERSVGESVVVGFYKRYKINKETGKIPNPPEALPTFQHYVCDLTKPVAFIVDTDGTVANGDGIRSPYDASRYHLDTLNEHVGRVVTALSTDAKIVALSGRDEAYRGVTEIWWAEKGLTFDEFFFRPRRDVRMDAIVKYELFKEHIEPNYNVLGAFDDRPQVIRMWRTIGVPVFDVGNGLEF